MNTPRMRMFAGLNGSGKSTLNSTISKQLLGVYVNPDEIEKRIKSELMLFFKEHALIKKVNLSDEVINLNFFDNKIDFSQLAIDSYYASVCYEFIPQWIKKYLLQQ